MGTFQAFRRLCSSPLRAGNGPFGSDPTPSPSQREEKTNKANPPHATATGAGTRDHLVQALKDLDSGYTKEVADIKGMQGITEAERAAGLKSLKERYEKARGDLSKRIDRIEQTAEDLAFAYGGKASDYYKDLDDGEPKVQELMGLLDHLEAYGFKDVFLLALRRTQGGPLPPPSDSHVLNAALQVATSVVGSEGSAVEKRLHAAEKSAVEEAAAKAGKLKQLLENVVTGIQRAAKTAKELADENPGKAIQHERTLRDANGNKVLDPVTGEGRRVDHVVIDRDANTAKTYETTGENVDKRLQQEKEERIIKTGGIYVRDRETGKLVPVEGVSEVRRQK